MKPHRKRAFLCLIIFTGLLSLAGMAVFSIYSGKGAAGDATHLLLPDDDIPYNQTAWICSHNAMSNSEDGWFFPNQNWNIPRQLREGIHVQMWDVWDRKGVLVLEHGNGKFSLPGKISLEDAIAYVKDYLDQDSRAVITLILESYVDNSRIREAFIRAGVHHYCYWQMPHTPWPTMGELRSSGKRLILFTDRPDGEENWPMPLWKHCVETPWRVKSPDDFQAKYNRGQDTNALFIANHFITSPVAAPSWAEKANTMDSLEKHKRDIEQKLSRTPNFWALDFVDIGEGKAFIEAATSRQND